MQHMVGFVQTLNAIVALDLMSVPTGTLSGDRLSSNWVKHSRFQVFV
jgi:hypothetical protein